MLPRDYASLNRRNHHRHCPQASLLKELPSVSHLPRHQNSPLLLRPTHYIPLLLALAMAISQARRSCGPRKRNHEAFTQLSMRTAICDACEVSSVARATSGLPLA